MTNSKAWLSPRAGRIAVLVGIGLLAFSVVLFVGAVSGLIPAGWLASPGHSWLRTVGNVAVAGCLIAAIGSWE
ncbi:MAG: hypothetical protein ABI567_06765 [Gammaproteobacteria bacterium]